MSESVSADDLHIKGEITTLGDIELKGTVEGEVTCRTLLIAEEAKITGKIKAEKKTKHQQNGNVHEYVYYHWRPLNFQDSLHIRSFPAGAGGMFDHSGRQFRRFQPVLPDLATSRRTPPVDCHTRLRLRRRL